MNQYKVLSDKHQKEINEFPISFAFSNQQFAEGMKKLGLSPDDTDKVYKLGESGGFYRREDAEKLNEIFARHRKEMQDEIDNDPTGDSFIYDMFNYELSNHEYVVTGDVSDTLNALGLTYEKINNDKKLLHGLKKAIKAQQDHNN